MYTEKQQERILERFILFEQKLEPLLFTKIDELEMSKYFTVESQDTVPDERMFQPCEPGEEWGGEWSYCWFRGRYQVPEQYAGQKLYLKSHVGGYEAMLWVNQVPHGIFTSKICVNSHGNHYCDCICVNPKQGEVLDIALEAYAHHLVIGTQTFEDDPQEVYRFIFQGADICLKNEEICDVYFNLKTVNEMVKVLPPSSFRRADLVKTLLEINDFIYYDYEHADQDLFLRALARANQMLKEQLAKKNAQTMPLAGVIGHSHMDTAWLWTQKETLKKCARTYSNQMNLMEQYPEYLFVQSSAYHGEIIKEHYPELFAQIKERVAQGRYEPNGGAYIECDCNIPSGESMIRQFVRGQRFNEENYRYRSDSFWLPDTFGYSVSLPQIMKGCGITYFLTTKLDWNDVNRFPYDTFYWRGLDGTKVLVHLNRTHMSPDPLSMSKFLLEDTEDSIRERTVSDMRLLSYGFGDGGGGPEFEMIEMARRLKDTEGMPRVEHMTVSGFMQRLEQRIHDPSVYSGELYLELHRGTLTNQHTIKRNNRLAEIALHNLEYALVRQGIRTGEAVFPDQTSDLWKKLLVNQFHDILPGTCIPEAHEQARTEVVEVIEKAADRIRRTAPETDCSEEEQKAIYVTNTLSFDRDDVFYLEIPKGYKIAGDYRQQWICDGKGREKLAVAGCRIPAFSTIRLSLIPGIVDEPGVFRFDGTVIEAPHERIVLNEKGYMDSYFDLEEQRELRGEGYALNTLLYGEEISKAWDNWDVDADTERRLGDRAERVEQKVISDGPVELRIRNRYRLSEKSSVTQDMIIYADTKEVRYETWMDWQEEHRFLKAAFDTSIFADTARQEVQFGYIRRPTTRNDALEKAKFEVSNHKYTDLSEMRYGAAVLNDCKYGISVCDSGMHLSLHKGGIRPDYKGDKGLHYCEYSFLPHKGGFSSETVIRPAYCLNVKPLVLQSGCEEPTLVSVDADHVIIETIKPAEDGGKSVILRLYEAEGTSARTNLTIHFPCEKAELTNMLEEPERELDLVSGDTEPFENRKTTLTFRPFEIKTVRLSYL